VNSTKPESSGLGDDDWWGDGYSDLLVGEGINFTTVNVYSGVFLCKRSLQYKLSYHGVNASFEDGWERHESKGSCRALKAKKNHIFICSTYERGKYLHRVTVNIFEPPLESQKSNPVTAIYCWWLRITESQSVWESLISRSCICCQWPLPGCHLLTVRCPYCLSAENTRKPSSITSLRYLVSFYFIILFSHYSEL